APRASLLTADISLLIGDKSLQFKVQQPLLPSIGTWWIAGPFNTADYAALTKAFGPEKNLDLEATYDGSGGEKIRGTRAGRPLDNTTDPTSEYYVDFHKALGKHHDNAVAYAVAFLTVPRATGAVLALGSDDGAVAWLNGVEILRRAEPRPFLSKQDRVPIHL